MKRFNTACLLLLLTITPLYAKNPPLRVAITAFTPPFVMQSTQQYYGFDISMMNFICQAIKRECQYQSVPFAQLIQTVADHKADVALSGITISLDRASLVHFSLPYLVSQSRYIGKSTLKDQAINVEFLQHSRIGIKTGSLFNQLPITMDVVNPTIVNFGSEEELIVALQKGIIDVGLLNNYTALYWVNHSSGKLAALGKPYSFGGLGIAVERTDLALLASINAALKQFQNSEAFKKEYRTYLKFF